MKNKILEAFAAKAAEVAPDYQELQSPEFGTIQENIGSVVDYMFSKHGEMVGGMAYVIGNLVAAELKA